ncbi:MAG: hypothetical protein ACPGRG_00830 [Marinomonas sp.]|nr:hypothetical protein [Marinomonas pontica]MCW8355810.1 hypothetical protein [Marinomonas pontica]
MIDNTHLGMLNDDDFATCSTKGQLEQKNLNRNAVWCYFFMGIVLIGV